MLGGSWVEHGSTQHYGGSMAAALHITARRVRMRPAERRPPRIISVETDYN